MEDVQAVIGGIAALIAVGAFVAVVGVVWDLAVRRRRSWLEQPGRPAPSTTEDWRREAELSAARSAARRAS